MDLGPQELVGARICRIDLARVNVLHTLDEAEDRPLGYLVDVPYELIARYRKMRDEFNSMQAELDRVYMSARKESR